MRGDGGPTMWGLDGVVNADGGAMVVGITGGAK